MLSVCYETSLVPTVDPDSTQFLRQNQNNFAEQTAAIQQQQGGHSAAGLVCKNSNFNGRNEYKFWHESSFAIEFSTFRFEPNMEENVRQEDKKFEDGAMTNSEMSLSQEVSAPSENDEESEESDEVLEAATIYVLMSKQFRLSRNARAQWWVFLDISHNNVNCECQLDLDSNFRKET